MWFDAMQMHRVAHALYRKRVPALPSLIDGLIFLFFNSRIHHKTEVGPGSGCAYRGMSVLIHKNVIIGSNVRIGAHVVLGGEGAGRVISGSDAKGVSSPTDVPIIGNNVSIAANACIVGPVVVGDGAHIGADSVVVKDVPPNAIVVGVPGRVVGYRETTEMPADE